MSFAKGSGEKDASWEKYLLTVIATFGSFFLGMIVAANFMQEIPKGVSAGWSTTIFSIQLIPYLFGLVGLLASVKFIMNRPILSVITSRKKFDWKRFFFAFG